MNNPVWEWLIRTELSAYEANQLLQGPTAREAGPCWCFHRFGRTTTELGDGRTVLVAGEHEDSYDADFCIYNDVVVRHPDGSLDVLGYPREVFPPTDFHSATLSGNELVLIGRLGYPAGRRPGSTPVLLLSLDDFAMHEIATTGTPPGWIYKHAATPSADGTAVVVTGGYIERADDALSEHENIDDWRLDLVALRWERLTERHWPRFEVYRSDRKPLHLWQLKLLLWARSYRGGPEVGADTQRLREELGSEPRPDLLADLYRPSLPHSVLPERDEEVGVERVLVDGVTVRFVDGGWRALVVTVEGTLPDATVAALTEELARKLAVLEDHPCALRQLP